MSKRYADRTLNLADVYSVSWRPGDGTTHLDEGRAVFTISGPGGQDSGPSAQVELAISHEPNRNLPDAEKELLRAAHEVIQRLAEFDFEEVYAAYLEARKPSNWVTKRS